MFLILTGSVRDSKHVKLKEMTVVRGREASFYHNLDYVNKEKEVFSEQ